MKQLLSYTSKTSFLDNDVLPTLGEKPQGWKQSGKRGKKGDGIGRGSYKTATFLANQFGLSRRNQYCALMYRHS